MIEGFNQENNQELNQNNQEPAGNKPEISGINKKLAEEMRDDYLNKLDYRFELEGQIVEDYAKSKDKGLREYLMSLRKIGEDSLKQLSAKAVEAFNSNRLVTKLRDIYIEKRGDRIHKELSVANELAQAEDYDSFLKLAQSDFWGKSKTSDTAITRANTALYDIAVRFPEKEEEVIGAWPKLFSRPQVYNSGKFDNLLNKVKADRFENLETLEEKLAFIRSSRDLVALKCLSSLGLNYEKINVPEEVEKRLDSLAVASPDWKFLPSSEICSLLLEFTYNFPDKVMADSRRVNFLFQIWLNRLQGHPSQWETAWLVPIFVDRIKSCSNEEKEWILNNLNISYTGCDMEWVIDLLPIGKKDLKNIKKKKGLSDADLLNLKTDKILGEDVSEKQLDLLKERAASFAAEDEVVFLSQLIVNYPDQRLGVDEDGLAEVLDKLLERNKERFNINTLHSLTELMRRHNWPASLKQKVFQANKVGSGRLNAIFSEEEARYAWVKEDPLLFKQLQLDFHHHGGANELRHYFYEVLEGRKQSDNLDDLIISYSRSQSSFEFEEIKSLFLEGKIDRKYINYYLQKISNEVILSGLRNNLISRDDEFWLLEMAVRHGQAESADFVLERLFEVGEISNPDKRRELIASLADNTLNEINGIKDRDRYDYSDKVEGLVRQVLGDGSKDFLSPEEASFLGRRMIEGALSLKQSEDATIIALKYPNKIKELFPNEVERKEYLVKLFDKLVISGEGGHNRRYHKVLSVYFSDPELVSVLDSGYRSFLEDNIFRLSITPYFTNLLNLIDEMNEGQKQKFVTAFNNDFKLALVNDQSVLATALTNSTVFFKNRDICQQMCIKVLNDPALKSNAASIFFNQDIIFSSQEMRQAFFGNLKNWPVLDGVKILESMHQAKDSASSHSLTKEEVETISQSVMSRSGLSPRFWRGYLNSNPEDPSFYLNEEIFQTGLENIGGDCFKEKGQAIADFLKSLAESEFTIGEDKIRDIMDGALKWNLNAERIAAFYQYNPKLTEEVLVMDLDNRLYEAVKADINYSQEFNYKLLNNLERNKFSDKRSSALLEYFKKNGNSEMIAETKRRGLDSDDKEKGFSFKKILLQHDLLDAREAKEMYQQATSDSKENPRSQILNSIDIIGSMLSNRGNIDRLGSFLDKPRPEDIENLREISEFIGRYEKENKGRTVVVMLFAREYLPDRPLEDVISRVSHSLRKYEDILQKNSYKNIPEGFHASVGMEYEITSSTAEGYQELTSRDSLKSDIAKISEAARIGSGRDAVHEIATKPTDNPYLMLLEMKLLDDIEYVDLNFSRSEKYRKGARGFHLTIGGEKGLEVSQETNFLQNTIIAASWAGVQAGETGHKVNGGRGVSLRGRSADDSNNIAFFEKKTSSVELRSFSIDKQETLQRAVTTAFNGAVAIQAFRECFPRGSSQALEWSETEEGKKIIEENLANKDEKVAALARLWLELIKKVSMASQQHNEAFLSNENFGYLDDNESWVDAADFGGEYNRQRFESVIASLDPTLSVEEYVNSTKIQQDELFKSFSKELSDKLIKINNLYLKPGTVSRESEEKAAKVFKGDNANAASMLKVTKLNNSDLEDYDDDLLESTVFDTAGERRKGYYCLQGASERMFTHAVQRALLDFNAKVEALLN